MADGHATAAALCAQEIDRPSQAYTRRKTSSHLQMPYLAATCGGQPFEALRLLREYSQDPKLSKHLIRFSDEKYV